MIQYNLVIDSGNTLTKLAVFKNNELVYLVKCTGKELVGSLENLFVLYDFCSCILSSVSNEDFVFIKKKYPNLSFVELNYKLRLPFFNNYSTPNTLGVDRIALAAAGSCEFTSRNILIIDAGTCITYDFLSSENLYLGGSISPGIQMRYKSLHSFTAKLPLLDKDFPNSIIGDSTVSSIHSGVCVGVVKEIEGVISEFSNIYKDLVVLLTGGDAIFLSKRLKNSIFVDQNFILKGLNYILDFNKNQ